MHPLFHEMPDIKEVQGMKQDIVKRKLKADRASKSKAEELRQMILHNDEVNTFDHVIDSLIAVCSHNSVQAEQCAFITHHNGKCDVKSGTYTKLAPMRTALLDRGLQVTID